MSRVLQEKASGVHARRDPDRILALDGIRGVAILMVLAGHAYGVLPGFAPAGVGLFFVLSGFLITTTLLSEAERSGGRISLRGFYLRRALRLFPALGLLLLTALVYVLVATDGATKANALRSLWSSAAYVSNWLQALGQEYELLLGHTWSLATEEQFYIIWPVALIGLCAIRDRRQIVGILIGLIVASAALRAFLHFYGSPMRGSLYFSPVTWADSLLVGCLLGIGYVWKLWTPRVSVPALVSAFSLLFLAIMSSDADLMFSGGTTAMALSFAVIIWAAVAPGRFGKVFAVKGLRWIGRHSYGIYLWQGPIVGLVLGRLGGTRPVTATVAVAATCVVAWASFRYVEAPFLRLKDRMTVPRSDGRVAADMGEVLPALEPAPA